MNQTASYLNLQSADISAKNKDILSLTLYKSLKSLLVNLHNSNVNYFLAFPSKFISSKKLFNRQFLRRNLRKSIVLITTTVLVIIFFFFLTDNRKNLSV